MNAMTGVSLLSQLLSLCYYIYKQLKNFLCGDKVLTKQNIYLPISVIVGNVIMKGVDGYAH